MKNAIHLDLINNITHDDSHPTKQSLDLDNYANWATEHKEQTLAE